MYMVVLRGAGLEIEVRLILIAPPLKSYPNDKMLPSFKREANTPTQMSS